MKKVMIFVVAGFAAAAMAGPQQYVIGVDSTNRAAHLFDPTTGALVQQNYLQWGSLFGGSSSTAKHALQVGNQIWVSDQLRDVVYRFGLNGSYLGAIGNAGLDNIKGMEVVGDKVWVTNAGTNNGAPGNSIVFIDIATASVSGSVSTVGSLFDVVNFQGKVLAGNITNQELELYDLSGNLLGNFHESDGVSSIDFPQQLFVRDNGNVYAAGFSPPSGVYEFDSAGNSLGIVAGLNLGPRGVLELGNGQIMWTNGSGFFVGGTNVFSTSGQYLSYVVIPAPGGLALVGLGGLAAVRRRRA